MCSIIINQFEKCSLLLCIGSGEGLRVIMALIGKFAVAGSFAVIYLYTAELFPTQVRYVQYHHVWSTFTLYS